MFKNLEHLQWEEGRPLPILYKQMLIMNLWFQFIHSIKDDDATYDVDIFYKILDLLSITYIKDMKEEQFKTFFEKHLDVISKYIENIQKEIEEINKKNSPINSVKEEEDSEIDVFWFITKISNIKWWYHLTLGGAFAYIYSIQQQEDKFLNKQFLNIAYGTGLHKIENCEKSITDISRGLYPELHNSIPIKKKLAEDTPVQEDISFLNMTFGSSHN